MQLKQIRCGLVVVWTTLQSYLLFSSSEMQTAVKVVISFPVNLNWQKRDVWCTFSTVIFFKGNLASEWFKKKKNFVLVKDNNSYLASRRCSHDPYVSFTVDLLIYTKRNKSEPPAKINVILRIWNCIRFWRIYFLFFPLLSLPPFVHMEDLAHWLKNYMILSIFAYNNNNNKGGGGGGGVKRRREKSTNDKFLFLFLFNILQAWLTKQDYHYGNKTEVTKSVRKTERETKWKK